MFDSITSILTVAGIALLVTLIWGATIAFVYWDTTRRPGAESHQLLWMILAALLPLVGFIAFLISRLLARSQARKSGTQPYSGVRRTAYKRPPGSPVHMPTVAGLDLIKPTAPAAQPAQPAPQPRQAIKTTYSLEVAEGPHKGQRFLLEQLPVRIGRGSSAYIRLNEDLGISRHHAEINGTGGRLQIRDLASTHGTYLNGRRITEGSLKAGDEIRIGTSLLVVKSSQEHS